MPDGDAANVELSTGYNRYSGCNVLMLISLSIWERRVVDVCGIEGCLQEVKHDQSCLF